VAFAELVGLMVDADRAALTGPPQRNS